MLSREARGRLGELVHGVLGVTPAELREPVALRAIDVPRPRLRCPLDFCDASDDERIRHTYGRAYPDLVRGFRGEFPVPPDVVAFPRDEGDITRVLEWADAHSAAVVPYGGGTSVVGGVSSDFEGDHAGVVSVDLRYLDRVVEIDDVSRAARIEAGATGPSIERQLAPRGLTLRHFPQSYELSTLGGWIATRAGGHFATGPTHIDDFVESTRMVTPRGTMQTRRLPASGAGPAPDRLVLGSEGTLGIITEAWMRVQRRPRYKSSGAYHFERWRDAVAAVRTLAQSGLQPSNCRLLDATEAMMNQVAFDGSHVLLVGFESADVPVADRMALATEIATQYQASCPGGVRHRTPERDEAAREGAEGSWREAFFRGPYLQSAMVTMGLIADTFESAVTWDQFDAFHRGVKDAVREALAETCGGGLVSCRFTHVYPDGVAPYYTFVGPAPSGGELDAWRDVKSAAAEAVMRFGGTITHHHAVGRTHRPWYERERPELFAEMLRAAKQAVDPGFLLNPGVLLSPPSRP